MITSDKTTQIILQDYEVENLYRELDKLVYDSYKGELRRFVVENPNLAELRSLLRYRTLEC